VTNSVIANVKADAMDFEYDTYSSYIPPGSTTALVAAQDNISIDHDTFKNWGADWFASIQGQTKCQMHHKPTRPCPQGGGVQQQNVSLIDNTLNAARPLVEIVGTNAAYTTQPYLNDGLTITGNVNEKTARPVHGGAITKPFAGSVMTIENVQHLDLSNNVFPVFSGTPTYYPDHPYATGVKPVGINGFNLTHNAFHGAIAVIQGASNNTAVTKCQNAYDVNGAKNDGPCP
jgi:hypothetical protein